MKTEPLVFERTYHASVEKVWKALTDVDQIRQWSFGMKAFSPEVGCQFSFEAKKDGIVFNHLCTVKEVIPGKKLAYTWRYEGYAGDSLVSFELFADGAKTKVRLTHEGLETFPQNNPDFVKGNFSQGWSHIIGESLKNFVENQAISP
ncbi:MAG: SRPBCC domain-containing protein [Puia sp.]|nr:SRPBCC domain-containing protein [Puia sp.]